MILSPNLLKRKLFSRDLCLSCTRCASHWTKIETKLGLLEFSRCLDVISAVIMAEGRIRDKSTLQGVSTLVPSGGGGVAGLIRPVSLGGARCLGLYLPPLTHIFHFFSAAAVAIQI